MQTVKIPATKSYHDTLIASLQNPEEIAAYITAILDEEDPEPELLPLCLQNVLEGMAAAGDDRDHLSQSRQKLAQMLSPEETKTIYQLAALLKTLGLQLTVTRGSLQENETY